MGIWRMIKSREDFLAFQWVMASPIPAWRAAELFHTILGDDNLCDHFLAASSIDKGADVRSLVINRIDQLYFTETSADIICDVDVASALRACVDSFKPADNDIFFSLQTIRSDIDARQPVMWVCDDNDGDPDAYTVKRDAVGLDYVVVAPDDKVYRVEAIHACVVSFNHDNAVRYHVSSSSSLTMN
jgi:hypothetical protein